MSTKNVKISITVITCVLVLVFGLTAFFLFFDNEKQNNSVDAATVTETYKFSPTFVEFNVTYDNTYGSIMSMDGALHPFNDWYSLTDFQITFSLSSDYIWSSSSVRITISGFQGTSSQSKNFNRSGNTWVCDISFGDSLVHPISTLSLTFPFYSVVQRSTSTIFYNLNSGTAGSTQPTEYGISSSSQTLTVSNPSRIGYNFNGWTVSWTDSDYSGTLPSVSGTTLTIPANTYGNITLTANWSARNYNITYNLGGGSHGSTHPSTYTFSSSRQTKTISNPSRTGYTFNSWTLSRSSYGGSTPTISGTTLSIPASSYGNIILTANWSANTYYIVYNGNGATRGSMANTTCSYGSTYTLTANAFVRTGYNFVGWATSENGTVAYSDRASVSNLTSTNGASFNLYAVWEIQSFKVSVNINDTTKGSVSGTGTYHYGDSVTLTAIPSSALNRFVWWESADGQMLSTSSIYTIDFLTADITLRAIFASNDAVTYATNGGETRIYNDGTYLHAKAIAYRGYTFLSWVTNDGTDMTTYTSSEIAIPLTSIDGKVLIAQFAVQGQTTPTTIFQGLEQEVTANATTGGEVRISGYDLTDATFVHLSAINYLGYRFIGWTANDGTDLSAYGMSANIPINLIKGKVITANFELINDSSTNPDTDNGYTMATLCLNK